MKKIIFTFLIIILAIGAIFYIKNTSSNNTETIALISNTEVYKAILSHGATPQSFFKLDLGGELGDEVFGSYRMGNEGDEFVKTAFVVFSNKSGEWKEIAYSDFMGTVDVFMRKEKGSNALIARVKTPNGNQERHITIEKLSERGYDGFEYEIEKGF
jgi:hypothetical protein